MKLHIAYENDGPLTKLSPALQALNLNLIKAAPSDFPLLGLHSKPQPGYSSYIGALPAFLLAEHEQKNIPLQREGYYLPLPIDKLIPLPLPNVFTAFEKQTEVVRKLITDNNGEIFSDKDKACTTTTPFSAGLLPKLAKIPTRKDNIFPPIGTVSLNSYPELIQCLRVFSQFFRIHTYPAFRTAETDEVEPSDQRIERTKRKFSEAELGGMMGNRYKALKLTTDGIPEYVPVNPEKPEVILARAKPSNSVADPWGDISDIPNTDGIVFPFLTVLAKDDKDMVPRIIEQYFLKSIGNTVEAISDRFAKFNVAWKKDIYRTEVGHMLAHLALGIKVAIPSQARVYPIIEDNAYIGFYLSGAHFALGLRGRIIYPMSFSDNSCDIEALSTQEKTLKTIALKMWDEDKAAEIRKVVSVKSVMELSAQMDRKILQISVIEEIRRLAAGLRFSQVPLKLTIENVALVIQAIIDRKVPGPKDYVHNSSLAIKDITRLQLSRFGSLAPSPIIPGGTKVSVRKVPDQIGKGNVCFRLTSIETAVADWRGVLHDRSVLNLPQNLNSRYKHLVMRTEDQKKEWYRVIVDYVESGSADMEGLNEDAEGEQVVSGDPFADM